LPAGQQPHSFGENRGMKALIIIDVQNEFSAEGKRPVPSHRAVVAVISEKVSQARTEGLPIAWIMHFNRPDESPAFVPGTWGAELVEGFGPEKGSTREVLFEKDVYGAFTGTQVGQWLTLRDVNEVEIMGFYTHGCVSTTTREAIMAGLGVHLDIRATGTCAIEHKILGALGADEVKRSALLQLANMGADIF
jgi:nicotinamidase-related amidase